jgi:hypothetical protein
MDRSLFVANKDVSEPFSVVAQLIIDVKDGSARVTEYDIDAFT